MTVQALGYLGLGAARLDDWSGFATGRLGMQAVDRGGALRAFRMDDRKQRLIIHGDRPEGEAVLGWEVADAAALDALAARLEAAGTAVRQESRAAADQRCVAGLISFQDPAGNRVEACHGAQVADAPFRPGRDIAGFRAGPLGMGHMLLMVPQLDPVLAFYRDLLGFRVSDYMRAPVKAYFLHVNARHHSLALVEGPARLAHHLMLELYSFDDVGQGYDLALREPGSVAATLGRHPNDLMTSFYMRSPSPLLVEYGWGGREVDDATWQPAEMTSLGSFWGHQGLFDSLGDGPPPGDAPPPLPPQPVRRAPLHVMEGNYQRMSDVCPWWDAMGAGQGAARPGA
ncbi:VOC family protein [Roseicella aerolata]|uniref:VOC family protein n=1 Tax=Roseicella aerolata TaxID=2883479 RepID=A0A9X1LAU0_9PROT|nr:VOC family protein [Roseicella aerolata]MCB4825159.1 VOC family protein [Roseicella aerolata]